MAIYLDHRPDNYGRAYDTNVLYFKVHSDKYTQPNFTFYVELIKNTLPSATELITSKKINANASGYAWINPSDIFKNYLSPTNNNFDFDPSITGITEASNSINSYGINIYESYGAPPTITGHSSTGVTAIWLYNGCQQFISYESAIGGGNNQWVMLTGNTNNGNFLTDADYAYLDDDDYYFLYFINPPGDHIDMIEYNIYYNYTGVTYNGGGITGNTIDFGYSGSTFQETIESYNQSLIKNDINNLYINKSVVPPKPLIGPYSKITIQVTGFTMNQYGAMWYIPIGMKTLHNIFPNLNSNWILYSVDIYKGRQYKALNLQPFFVYRTNRDCRFSPYKVAWLNNHGGYDYFVFDKGSTVKDSEKRDIFLKDLQPGYSTYDAGTKVYNMNPDQQIEITTSLINTQLESQVLMGLFHSLQVFVIFIYKDVNGNIIPKAVPYIVTNEEMIYQNTQTDLTFPYTFTLTPSNKKIVQKL